MGGSGNNRLAANDKIGGMNRKPLTVFLAGSCVSRDTAEFRVGQWERTHFIARQSLISAAGPAVEMPDAPDLSSPFQMNAVNGDFRSSLFAAVKNYGKDADRIIIDLVDERLGVYPYENGGYLTFSRELDHSKLMHKMTGRGPFIEFGTDEHFELWKTAANRFLAELDSIDARHKARVVEAPFVDVTDAGEPVALTRGKPAVVWNALYRRYYDHLSNSGLTLVQVPASAQLSTVLHRWGSAQFHYVDSAYESLADQIEK